MADANSQLYTCLSCSIAFLSPEDQREHYKSDHHRYNMKRRVASLPPISAAVFNEKVLERKRETAIMSSTKGSTCHTCNKTYTTENAYRSHIQSKKHKESELKAALAPKEEAEVKTTEVEDSTPVEPPAPKADAPQPQSLNVDEDASEDLVMKTIDEKIAAARSRLSPLHCLFCPHSSPSLDENLTHMSTTHSFFVPDADYLVDIQGLINYLGEKIAVGNVCIFCNERGREFRTMDAVRKHMADKSHCKIAYDTEKDRLEISDFYDFTSSYGNLPSRRIKKKSTAKPAEEEQWEDTDDEDGTSADEIVDESPSEGEDDSESEEDLDDQLTYGDTPYELVLPSGARIGHRSLRRYYAQSFRPVGPVQEEDPNAGAALVRRLIADKNSALVPRKGGFGAFGAGTDVAKARNVGEAREAGRHVREFRDQRRREEYKTKVGFRHNSQKHFRDPLLQ